MSDIRTISTKIQHKYGTLSELSAANPVFSKGEMIVVVDENNVFQNVIKTKNSSGEDIQDSDNLNANPTYLKIGDGETAFNDLNFITIPHAQLQSFGSIRLGTSESLDKGGVLGIASNSTGETVCRVATVKTTQPYDGYGVVRLGTSTVLTDGAPCGFNSNDQLLTIPASTSTYGTVKLGTNKIESVNDGGLIGAVNGVLVARQAGEFGNSNQYGVVKIATETNLTSTESADSSIVANLNQTKSLIENSVAKIVQEGEYGIVKIATNEQLSSDITDYDVVTNISQTKQLISDSITDNSETFLSTENVLPIYLDRNGLTLVKVTGEYIRMDLAKDNLDVVPTTVYKQRIIVDCSDLDADTIPTANIRLQNPIFGDIVKVIGTLSFAFEAGKIYDIECLTYPDSTATATAGGSIGGGNYHKYYGTRARLRLISVN